MDDRRVEKDYCRISLLLADNSTLDGVVFLSHYKDHNSAPESAGELLNRAAFIPVNGPDGIVLVNVEKIVKATVPRRGELEENAETLGVRHMVNIRMLDGSSVKGEFLIDLPEESCRVKDYLNKPDRFFRLIPEGSVLYVNRHYILSVMD